MRFILFIIVSWSLHAACFAQKVPDILKFINSYDDEIPHIFTFSDTGGFAGVVPSFPGKKEQLSNNAYIKTANGLFLQPGGSGRVYKVDLEQMALIRIDSTKLTGYNWGALAFSFKDSIYSLGGYGLWRNNGHLRFYRDASNEWEVKPLDTELPIGNWPHRLWWLDKVKGKLYVCQDFRDSINEGIIDGYPQSWDPNNKGSVFELDLITMHWKRLGAVCQNADLIGGMPIGMSPWGLLVENDARNYVICDFLNNKIYKVPSVYNKIKIRAEHLKGYSFFVDSVFYYGDVYKNTFDSIILSAKDLIFTGEVFYSEKQADSIFSRKNMLFGGLLCLGLFGLFLFWKVRKDRYERKTAVAYNLNNDLTGLTSGKPENSNPAISIHSGVEITPGESASLGHRNNGLQLTEVEKSLIKLFISLEKKQRMASVHDLDKVLGVAGKPESTRKNIRNDAINSINQKVSYRGTGPSRLIESRRSELDRRIFEYYIPADQLKRVDELGLGD
jgi:hypothetical protein